MTSRLSSWPGAVESLALDVLEESDAVAFLLETLEYALHHEAEPFAVVAV